MQNNISIQYPSIQDIYLIYIHTIYIHTPASPQFQARNIHSFLFHSENLCILSSSRERPRTSANRREIFVLFANYNFISRLTQTVTLTETIYSGKRFTTYMISGGPLYRHKSIIGIKEHRMYPILCERKIVNSNSQ